MYVPDQSKSESDAPNRSLVHRIPAPESILPSPFDTIKKPDDSSCQIDGLSDQNTTVVSQENVSDYL